MKTLNITFEDQEYKLMVKLKKEKSWRDFFLDMAYGLKSEKEDENGNRKSK